MPTPREHLEAATDRLVGPEVMAADREYVMAHALTGLLSLCLDINEQEPAILAFGKLAEIRAIIDDPDPDADAGEMVYRIQTVLDRTEDQ